MQRKHPRKNPTATEKGDLPFLSLTYNCWVLTLTLRQILTSQVSTAAGATAWPAERRQSAELQPRFLLPLKSLALTLSLYFRPRRQTVGTRAFKDYNKNCFFTNSLYVFIHRSQIHTRSTSRFVPYSISLNLTYTRRLPIDLPLAGLPNLVCLRKGPMHVKTLHPPYTLKSSTLLIWYSSK